MLLAAGIVDGPHGSATDVTEVLADQTGQALLHMVAAEPRGPPNAILFRSPDYCATAPRRKILCECNAASAALAVHEGPFKRAYDARDAEQLFGLDPICGKLAIARRSRALRSSSLIVSGNCTWS